MTRTNRAPGGRTRLGALVGAGTLVAGLATALVPATLATAAPDDCEQGQAVQRTADFLQRCLPGEAPAEGAAAKAEAKAAGVLPEGAQASKRMALLANIPKAGAFAQESSFNSDIAFQGDYAFIGNYDGFVIYDVKNPARPQRVTQVVCPGSQNDVSVMGDLLFLSTDSRRTDDSCQSGPAAPISTTDPTQVLTDYWEGIKVFDISDVKGPRYVAAVETDCGSHTHTLVPDKAGETAYLYVSSYSPSPQLADCQPPHDKISIVEVPLDDPASARVAAEPVLFPRGGNPGSGPTKQNPNGWSATTGCHDITAYPEKDIAAGACMGDGVLWDISDRLAPKVIDQVRDNKNFSFWHSATFNNAGTKVVFTDELGGGGAPTCNPQVGPNRGADGIYDIEGEGRDSELVFKSYYKIPRAQSDTENCVAHNGSLIPVEGRDIMVQAWYQGGISVFDFTDSENPVELAWFDRGALDDERLVLGGSWSAYWYNGKIISSDIQKGLDVLDVRHPLVNGAKSYRYEQEHFNPQSQPQY
ncbi:LVIVD repeat-containing protein [Vallicoccus soli]|uniref:LVIVD repeat-containing protein n=1 Tax=Vallicoccus soli TaxID=2339232 RepID=A0A3A3Z2U0_9ACTN|nr:hypothetical protein [Vallicoccus soli]RJK97734.1 hypothetical protein D5H78_01660 [Vallicoccus soli]